MTLLSPLRVNTRGLTSRLRQLTRQRSLSFTAVVGIVSVIAISVFASERVYADNRFNNQRFHNNWNGQHKSVRQDFRHNRFGNFRSNISNRNRFNHNHRRSSNSRAFNDHWSISLNVGTTYTNRAHWTNSGFSAGVYSRHSMPGLFYNTRAYYPGYPNRNRTRVIVNQPTVIYVNESPVTRQVVRSSTVSHPRHSLLKDIHGNCFERTIDSSGNETRVQVSAYDCDF